jgi:lipoprotein-anchoring transpeptidase ErfK/SrfK
MWRRIVATVAAIALGTGLLAPAAFGDGPGDTTTTTAVSSTSTTTPTGSSTTTPMMPAVRNNDGYQATPTLAEPTTTTTTLPPTTTTVSPGASTDVPANSGNGQRVVYAKRAQRVWIINGDNTVARTYLVSGRKDQPNPGTYSVWSRSAYTCAINNNKTCMRYMVRFAHGPEGDNIGFHEIPRNNGVPLQSDSQLGIPLSHGCVRQSTEDAQFMWGFAGVGTVVVVIA